MEFCLDINQAALYFASKFIDKLYDHNDSIYFHKCPNNGIYIYGLDQHKFISFYFENGNLTGNKFNGFGLKSYGEFFKMIKPNKKQSENNIQIKITTQENNQVYKAECNYLNKTYGFHVKYEDTYGVLEKIFDDKEFKKDVETLKNVHCFDISQLNRFDFSSVWKDSNRPVLVKKNMLTMVYPQNLPEGVHAIGGIMHFKFITDSQTFEDLKLDKPIWINNLVKDY